MISRISILILFLLPISASAWTTVSGQSIIKLPINRLVTMPTTRMMQTGLTEMEFRFEPEGILRFGGQFGVFQWLTVGLYYGGELLYFDYDKLTLKEPPGILIKYSLCDESKLGPAVTLGIDTQGWGSYDKKDKRYLFKAPGLYIAASKNVFCRCFGTVGMHGGINYNLLEKEDDGDPNLYLGLDRHLWKWFSFAVEYNLAVNDNENANYSTSGGYISARFRFQDRNG